MWLMQNGLANPNNAGAAAYPYMNLMGMVCLGLMWLRMAKASAAALADGAEDKAFHEAKLVTARFYADRILPEAGACGARSRPAPDSLMALPAEASSRSRTDRLRCAWGEPAWPAPANIPLCRAVSASGYWLDPAVEVDRTRYPFSLGLFGPEFELGFDRPVTHHRRRERDRQIDPARGRRRRRRLSGDGRRPGYITDRAEARAPRTKAAGSSRPCAAAGCRKSAAAGSSAPRAFSAVARYLDDAALDGGGARPIFSHSHGEGFLRFFGERCPSPALLFDEPESGGLSPTRQFEFLKLLHRMTPKP